jgi:hypothetical protein
VLSDAMPQCLKFRIQSQQVVRVDTSPGSARQTKLLLEITEAGIHRKQPLLQLGQTTLQTDNVLLRRWIRSVSSRRSDLKDSD